MSISIAVLLNVDVRFQSTGAALNNDWIAYVCIYRLRKLISR